MPTQLTLIPDDTATAGAKLAKLIVEQILQGKIAATTKSEPFTNRDMLRIATPICEQALANAALTRAPRASIKRGELFTAFCRVCAMTEADLTHGQARTTAVHLAQIKQATPAVDLAELERRAKAYQRKYPTAPITTGALSSRWGEFGNGHLPKKHDLYVEPNGWRAVAKRIYPDAANWITPRDFDTIPWAEIRITLGPDILKHL